MKDSSFFVGDRDLIDSLRLDSDVISPKEQKEISSWITTIQEELLKTFGRYLQQQKIDENKDLADRLIITHSDEFNVFEADWRYNKSKQVDGISNIRAYTTDEGAMIIFNNPRDSWMLLGEEIKKQLIIKYGDEENAQKIVASILFFDHLVHEVVHRYQDESLPLAFLECGVRYYQRKIVEKLFGTYLIFELDNERIAFYEKLVSDLGEEVHNVFFGTIDERWKRSVILNKLNSKVKNTLFPDEADY